MNNFWSWFTEIASRFNERCDGWEIRVEPRRISNIERRMLNNEGSHFDIRSS